MGTARGVIYRRMLVMSVLGMLLFPMLGIDWHHFTIQERTQAITQPAQLWDGFIKREWQPFLEQRFLTHIGNLRSVLILSYNETKHRLFPTRPNDHYIWTQELGYYPLDTIRRLNGDVLHHDAIKQHYQYAARRLRILQEMLGHHGVALLVVTPPPKVRVYPEYAAPYLIVPAATIMSQAVSYGDVLEESGVHVLNVQRIFLQTKAASPWPFFTTTSFHWSYWAGCTVTDEIMHKAETLTGRPFFKIDCSNVEYGRSKWSDTDIAVMLNIISTDAIIGEAPFPKITQQQNPGWETRKIGIIGDSYSDQIVYALVRALPEMSWSPGWLTRYEYAISYQPLGMEDKVNRQSFGVEGNITAQAPLQQSAALSEILTKELLVMEVSDGNISRDNPDHMEFGATRVLLDGLLQRTDAGIIDPADSLTSGWRALGNKQWHTTGSTASFAIRPPNNSDPIQLALDVESLAPNHSKPRLLNFLLDGKPIGQATLIQGRGTLNLTVPKTAQWQDSLVAEISLRDPFGQPLNMLLHGVRMVNADTAQKTNKVIAIKVLPTSKILKHASMRAINLISSEEPEDILVEGLSSFESSDKESWRWALGLATRIKFYVDPAWPDQARQLLLKFAFKNGVPIPEQTVTIRLNGKNVRLFSSEEIAMHELTDADVALAPKKGVNVLEFVYQDWNHGKKNYGSNDPRKLAVVFMHLSLQEVNN